MIAARWQQRLADVRLAGSLLRKRGQPWPEGGGNNQQRDERQPDQAEGIAEQRPQDPTPVPRRQLLRRKDRLDVRADHVSLTLGSIQAWAMSTARLMST